ncbi:MAG: glycerol-3-phosphate 1-O-acyltransferase PlsY [Clostridia bacterium]|nr:glycerol-3-phosphate 1-O-acyltransferase PlsY [Clostridia bacterium]
MPINLLTQVPWNLVDYLTQHFKLTENGASWLTVAGALVCIVIPYLLGSINPAVLISKIFFHEDIRNFGSGNAGTTNMLRTYGKGAAIGTFLFDLGKAAASFWIGMLIWSYMGAAIAGFFVVFGHMFPIFAHFKGGKGVACLAMIALCSSPITFLFLLLIFVVIVVGTRYISLASIMSALLYPLILNAFDGGKPLYVAMAVISACFVVFMHRENIKRLWAGKESKVSFSKTSKKKKNGEND